MGVPCNAGEVAMGGTAGQERGTPFVTAQAALGCVVGCLAVGCSAGNAQVADAQPTSKDGVQQALLQRRDWLAGAGGARQHHERREDHRQQRAAYPAHQAQQLAKGGDAHADGGREDHKHCAHYVHHRAGHVLASRLLELALEDLEGAADDDRECAQQVEAEQQLDGNHDALPLEHGQHHALHLRPKVHRADDAKQDAHDGAEGKAGGGCG
mmetsp:Transcript_17395/g.44547  ORF Transcript_17395/g.44547 Transcript_17395/m.44547 type:complete len:211 (+) Transcript_17395:44-676(+)